MNANVHILNAIACFINANAYIINAIVCFINANVHIINATAHIMNATACFMNATDFVLKNISPQSPLQRGDFLKIAINSNVNAYFFIYH